MKNIDKIIEEARVLGMSQNSQEISECVSFLLDKNIKNVLEIGSDKGGTFYLWCKIFDQSGKKIFLDLPYARFGSTDYDSQDRNKRMLSWSDNVFIVEGNSHDNSSLLRVKEILGNEKLDFLFLDGDHTYEGVKQDYEMYKDLVKEGGYIAFHDIKKSDFHSRMGAFVSLFWDEVKGEKIEWRYENDKFVNIDGIGGIGIVKKEGYKKDNSVFIIGSWIDTNDKKEVLKKNIDVIRKVYNSKIILVSHRYVDEDIIGMVDYFIYDKDNPILYAKDYHKYGNDLIYYFANNSFKVAKTFPFRHDYCVWSSMRNATNFAKYLGKENIFYLEYDCIINEEYFVKEFVDPLERYDACVLDGFGQDKNVFYFNFFSIKTDILLGIVNRFKSKDDYFIHSIDNCAEISFSRMLQEATKNIYAATYEKDGFIDTKGIFDAPFESFDGKKIYIIPCVDDQNNLYVALSSDVNVFFSLVCRFQNEYKVVNFYNRYDICVRKIGDINVLKDNDLESIFSIGYRDMTIVSLSVDEMIKKAEDWKITFKDDKTLQGICESVETSLETSVETSVEIDKDINMFYENVVSRKTLREIKENNNFVVTHNFIDGPFVEINSHNNFGPFNIKFIDKKDNKVVFQDNIMSNHWIKANRKWFTEWKIEVRGQGKTQFFDFNPRGKRVLICLDSYSLGDTLAWFPYVEEFRKKHDCHVICSTFANHFFKNQYKEIQFVNPGAAVDGVYAMYKIGWFNPINYDMNPNDYRSIPLQKCSSDILGLDYKEIRPKIEIPNEDRKIKEKYVCIGIHSSAQAKYWNYPGGWQKIVDYLNSIGYKVVLISKEHDGYMGNVHPKGVVDKTGDRPIEERIVDLKYADFYVGLGSGLSWLAWAIGTPVVMISGFSDPMCEFTTNVERIHNKNVCNSCFNNLSFLFDKGDWNWCPENKNFECTKMITPEMVISGINRIISKNKGKL